MIKCSKCYRDINDDNVNFCQYCGYPLRGNFKTFNIFKILRNLKDTLTKKPVKNKLRVVKTNLIIFAMLHLILEALMGVPSAGLLILFQYILAKKIIMDDYIDKVNTITQISKRCWKVSLLIFILSFILGIMLLASRK